MKKIVQLLVAVTFFLLPALAHERAEVGEYLIIVGQLSEPSMTGRVNGLDLIIRKKADNSPVEGAEKDLTVEITTPTGFKRTFTADGQYGPNSLWPQFGADRKGRYTTTWILTQPGQYTIRVYGKIGDTPVDVTFAGKTWLIKDRAAFELK